MNKDLLTVVIPHHNRVTLLLRLLHTIPDYVSVIVVDDGSESLLAIEEVTQFFSNVSLMSYPTSLGAGVARQLGLAHVTTPYVLFADSDDVFMPNAFDIILSYCEENFDVLVFKPTSLDLEGQHASRHLSHHQLFEDLNQGIISHFDACFLFKEVWSKVYRTSSVESFKFSKTFVGNDLLFSAQVAIQLHMTTHFSDQCIYAISDHRDAISYEHTKQRYVDRLVAIEEYFQYSSEHLDELTFKRLIKSDGVMIVWPLIKFFDIKLTLKTYAMYKKYNLKINMLRLIKRGLKIK